MRWEALGRISPRIVTRETPEAARRSETARRAMVAQPHVVFIYDAPESCDGRCRGACDRYYDIEKAMKDERVALATRPFRMIRMNTTAAKLEPMFSKLKVSRSQVVFLNAVTGKVVPLSPSKAKKPSQLYASMRRAFSDFYGGKLDQLVRRHEHLLIEHDKMGRALMEVQQRQGRAQEGTLKDRLNRRALAIATRQKLVDTEIEELWRLRPKPHD